LTLHNKKGELKMKWKPKDNISIANLNRMSISAFSSFTVFKDGTLIRGESNKPNIDDYSGTNASTILQNVIDATQ